MPPDILHYLPPRGPRRNGPVRRPRHRRPASGRRPGCSTLPSAGLAARARGSPGHHRLAG
eukprot:6982652-Lingulodinium_polyedra.AAC.1